MPCEALDADSRDKIGNNAKNDLKRRVENMEFDIRALIYECECLVRDMLYPENYWNENKQVYEIDNDFNDAIITYIRDVNGNRHRITLNVQIEIEDSQKS